MKAFGCGASLAYFALIFWLALGSMMGDCIPKVGQVCPTDYERDVRVLAILLGGIGLYAIAGILARIIEKRRNDNSN
jgi:hypothetical protein